MLKKRPVPLFLKKFQGMFPQRNRNLELIFHKEIVENRNIVSIFTLNAI